MFDDPNAFNYLCRRSEPKALLLGEGLCDSAIETSANSATKKERVARPNEGIELSGCIHRREVGLMLGSPVHEKHWVDHDRFSTLLQVLESRATTNPHLFIGNRIKISNRRRTSTNK